MTGRIWLAATLLLAPAGTAAQAGGNGFYLSTSAGLTSAFGADVRVFGDNHPTRCDVLLYANPGDAPADAACTAPLTSGPWGGFEFDRNGGSAWALALGYAAGTLRFEAELLHRNQIGAPADFLPGNDTALLGKTTEWSALAPPNADIYNFRSAQAFANVYLTFRNASAWTPYVGAGAGIAGLNFGYYQAFHRKSLDEGYLEAFGGSRSDPGAAPEWQRAAAGTLSMMDAQVRETAFGYQLLAGVDRALSERTTLGLKARWTGFQTPSATLPWALIRSHKPVRADGRTPFEFDFEFGRLGYVGLSAEMRYRF